MVTAQRTPEEKISEGYQGIANDVFESVTISPTVEPIPVGLSTSPDDTLSSNGVKDMSLYENKEQGYSIKHPSEWQAVEVPTTFQGENVESTVFQPLQDLEDIQVFEGENLPVGRVVVSMVATPPIFPYLTPENHTSFLKELQGEEGFTEGLTEGYTEGYREKFGQVPRTAPEPPEIVSISNYSMMRFALPVADLMPLPPGRAGQTTLDMYKLLLYGNMYSIYVLDYKTDSQFRPIVDEMLNSFKITEPDLSKIKGLLTR